MSVKAKEGDRDSSMDVIDSVPMRALEVQLTWAGIYTRKFQLLLILISVKINEIVNSFKSVAQSLNDFIIGVRRISSLNYLNHLLGASD